MHADYDDDASEFDLPVDPADAEADRRVLGWGTAANPNTADGELQGISAFAEAAIAAKGWRRKAARIAAWTALILIACYVLLVFGLATKIV